MYTYRWSQQHLFLKLYILNIALAEYIMRNAGLEEAQAGIKIAGRNIAGSQHMRSHPMQGHEEEA